MLEIAGLEVRYGGAAAIAALDLRVDAGEIVALLGSNGAGKTTLFSTISGLLRPVTGTIAFDGRSIAGARADRIVRAGISQCPEGRRLFPELSVEKNLRLGAYVRRRERGAIAASLDYVCELFPALREKLGVAAGSLSGGQQQMVAVARALMARPRLLLLDEPSLGLAPLIVEDVLAAVVEIARGGTMVLIAEQNAYATLAIARRAYVLQDGRIVLSGDAADVARDPGVRRAFIGA